MNKLMTLCMQLPFTAAVNIPNDSRALKSSKLKIYLKKKINVIISKIHNTCLSYEYPASEAFSLPV